MIKGNFSVCRKKRKKGKAIFPSVNTDNRAQMKHGE